MRTHTRAVTPECWFRFGFPLDLGLPFVYFCHFVPVLSAFVVLGLVSSVLRQESDLEERLQNDILCRVGRKLNSGHRVQGEALKRQSQAHCASLLPLFIAVSWSGTGSKLGPILRMTQTVRHAISTTPGPFLRFVAKSAPPDFCL